MKKLTITNEDNLKLNVDLVRYFKYKNDCFLIYTIGEFDEKNYQKLYSLLKCDINLDLFQTQILL